MEKCGPEALGLPITAPKLSGAGSFGTLHGIGWHWPRAFGYLGHRHACTSGAHSRGESNLCTHAHNQTRSRSNLLSHAHAHTIHSFPSHTHTHTHTPRMSMHMFMRVGVYRRKYIWCAVGGVGMQCGVGGAHVQRSQKNLVLALCGLGQHRARHARTRRCMRTNRCLSRTRRFGKGQAREQE